MKNSILWLYRMERKHRRRRAPFSHFPEKSGDERPLLRTGEGQAAATGPRPSRLRIASSGLRATRRSDDDWIGMPFKILSLAPTGGDWRPACLEMRELQNVSTY